MIVAPADPGRADHATVGRGTTAIEWATATWNPVTGCSKVSPGCAHCYIERSVPFRVAHRRFVGGATDMLLHTGRLDQPRRRRLPQIYFVNSLSDLFHEAIPLEFVGDVFAAMAAAPWHRFLILTKRPEHMLRVLRWLEEDAAAPQLHEWPLRNVWLGVTIENRRFVHRADLLRQASAEVRFISAEPLLGPIMPELDLRGIDWLIAGGESGPRHRPVRTAWIRELRDACDTTGVAFFFKQWGGARPKSGGRELDGRTWDELPQLAETVT